MSPAPDPGQVAELQGYVRAVDDRRVEELGSRFELLPGCHLILTPDAWGTAEGGKGGIMIHTGERLFAVPMKAGHSYSV